jgi:non-ribosomal peptide synthetase component F
MRSLLDECREISVLDMSLSWRDSLQHTRVTPHGRHALTASSSIASTMQDDFQLTITAILRHGATVNRRSECVTWLGDHGRHTSYAEIARNAERLAAALTGLGIKAGDRIGTFCWNNQEHLEAYYAVPCMGAVLHTLNIRLPAPQVANIVNHAGDRMVIVDGTLLPLFAQALPRLGGVEAAIVVGPGDTSILGDIRVLHYDELLAAQEPGFRWPEVDEKSAALMCYTSGTTGDPMGVVYSHRSTFLHALSGQAASLSGPTDADRILTFVPMFHVNAWGIPFGAFMSGASLHMPGPFMTAGPICDFLRAERSTLAAAVPTIWQAILQHGPDHGYRSVLAADGHVRGRGGTPLSAAGLLGQIRPADHPGLGDDRDLPGGRHGPPAGGRRARHRGGVGLADEIRPDHCGRRDADRRRHRGGAFVGRQIGRRDRGPRALDHGLIPPGSGAGQVPRRLAAYR